MTDTIAVSGIVASHPNPIATANGLNVTSFRLASTPRRFDRSRDRWVDGDTNWFTVTAFRQLAVNINTSVIKGDKVVVTGRLRIREWDNGEKKGINVDIEADSVGHDLAWGTTTFIKANSSAAAAAEPPAPEHEDHDEHFPSASAGLGGLVSGGDDDETESGSPSTAQPAFGEATVNAPF